ncbi:hypothetical protein ACXR2T_09370 [Leucobacter sp. HY1910]
MPDSKWFLVEVSNSGLANPVELVRPVESLLDSDPEPFPGNWDVLSFLLFSDTHDAAILYSAPYEYKLIAGSAQFVRKYIEGSEDEPLAELQSWFEEDIRIRRDKGQLKQAEEIRKTLNTALAQVKLPPSFG